MSDDSAEMERKAGKQEQRSILKNNNYSKPSVNVCAEKEGRVQCLVWGCTAWLHG